MHYSEIYIAIWYNTLLLYNRHLLFLLFSNIFVTLTFRRFVRCGCFEKWHFCRSVAVFLLLVMITSNSRLLLCSLFVKFAFDTVRVTVFRSLAIGPRSPGASSAGTVPAWNPPVVCAFFFLSAQMWTPSQSLCLVYFPKAQMALWR